MFSEDFAVQVQVLKNSFKNPKSLDDYLKKECIEVSEIKMAEAKKTVDEVTAFSHLLLSSRKLNY